MRNSGLNVVFPFLILLVFSSCKAYRNVENLMPKTPNEIQKGPFVKESLSKLVNGDKIQVLTLSGDTKMMVFRHIEDEKVVGEHYGKNGNEIKSNQKIEIPLGEIDKLYVKRVSPGPSIALGLVSVLGLIFGIYAIAVSSGDGYW